MIKAIDPSALVVGPEEWGWSGYFYSGYDQQYGSMHGWSVAARPQQPRRRRLPAVAARSTPPDAHAPPAAASWTSSPSTTTRRAASSATTSRARCSCGATARRARCGIRTTSTRPGSTIACSLIPRLRSWVNTYYPGTSIGITEYNWGAEGHINGATAQADVFGIFGREGLDMAARWTTPAAEHTDLQGDEDVPQLRRQQVHVRRDERGRDRRRTRTRSPPSPRSASADGALTRHGDQQAAVGQRRRRRSTSPTSRTAGRPRPGS